MKIQATIYDLKKPFRSNYHGYLWQLKIWIESRVVKNQIGLKSVISPQKASLEPEELDKKTVTLIE